MQDSATPLLVIFHGLEGSVRSPYADHLMCSAKARGWHAVTMHFRGCSGRVNRTHRAYHSGDTADARYVFDWLQRQNPTKPVCTAGFSLGGNMLVKLLGETPQTRIHAAVATSAPLALSPSSVRIDQGFSRIYRGHLLASLKRKVAAKLATGMLKDFLRIDAEQLHAMRSFRDFDNEVTARLHGFADVDDYYESCSGLRFLPMVRQPLLILHAADDPFTCPASFPTPDDYLDNVTYEQSRHGGHVGFISSRRGRPHYWLSGRILTYLEEQLCASHTSSWTPTHSSA
jgi:predicted alpha/beta-fold hydrolase